MPFFSEKSKSKLETVDERLRKIMEEVIKEYDLSIVWGYRDKALQNSFHRQGTGLKWPKSRHNVKPSEAVDVAPWKNHTIDWEDENEFVILAGLILKKARELGIELEWGGLWKRKDLGHFELKEKE